MTVGMTTVEASPLTTSQKLPLWDIYAAAASSMIIAASIIALSTFWFSSLESDTTPETIAFSLAIVSSIIQFKGTVVLLLWGIRTKVKSFLCLSAIGMFGSSILLLETLVGCRDGNKFQKMASPNWTTEQRRSFEVAVVCGMNLAFNAAVICLHLTRNCCARKKGIPYNVMA